MTEFDFHQHMLERSRLIEINGGKKMRAVELDGSEPDDRFAGFVVYDGDFISEDEGEKADTLLVYTINHTPPSHEGIHDLAIEEEIVDEDNEPIGGGLYDKRTGNYRESHYFGDAPDDVKDAFLDRLS